AKSVLAALACRAGGLAALAVGQGVSLRSRSGKGSRCARGRAGASLRSRSGSGLAALAVGQGVSLRSLSGQGIPGNGTMAKAKSGPLAVDDYIRAQPPKQRRALERVRRAIRKALPGAEEAISYRIPTFKVNGRMVLYCAAWKAHYSLYPSSDRLVAAF